MSNPNSKVDFKVNEPLGVGSPTPTGLIITGYQVALDSCFSLMESFKLHP